jgi:type III pantothenate kinase
MAARFQDPFLVADIGNTRIKWGWCEDGRVTRTAALPDDPDAWRHQLGTWHAEPARRWVLAGVHPDRRDRFAGWLRQLGYEVWVLTHFSQLPLRVQVERPEQVGIDRLLDVVAARAEISDGESAVVVDAGSAVTLNVMDPTGAFVGGAIFPGRRLMAEALYDHTAALPRVAVSHYPPVVPAGTTIHAIAAGIHWAVVGGIRALIEQTLLTLPVEKPLRVILTGGDAADLLPDLRTSEIQWLHRPWLTLEGLRIVAEHG